MDASGQLGLETAEMPVASQSGRRAQPSLPPFLGPAIQLPLGVEGHRPCHHTRLQSSRKLGRSLSVGWKLMRSE